MEWRFISIGISADSTNFGFRFISFNNTGIFAFILGVAITLPIELSKKNKEVFSLPYCPAEFQKKKR